MEQHCIRHANAMVGAINRKPTLACLRRSNNGGTCTWCMVSQLSHAGNRLVGWSRRGSIVSQTVALLQISIQYLIILIINNKNYYY
jgi:hypothetical protein